MFMEHLGENQPTFDVPTFTIQVNQMYLGKHTMASSQKFNAQPDPVPSQIQISHSWRVFRVGKKLPFQPKKKRGNTTGQMPLFFEASVGGGFFSILGNSGNSYKGDFLPWNMNILKPKSWRFGSEIFCFSVGWNWRNFPRMCGCGTGEILRGDIPWTKTTKNIQQIQN